MRTLLIGKDWFPNVAGGLNRYFYGEVNTLPSIGVSGVAIVSGLQPGQSAPLALRPMAAVGASLAERWRGVRRETRDALQEGMDLMNAHFALYAYPALRGLSTSLPLIVTFHGPYAREIAAESRGLRGRTRALLARQMEKAVYRRAACVVTLSHAFAEIAHRDYGVPRTSIRILPGGVDLAAYLETPERRKARERLGWPADRPILLTVRRLARRMVLESLIDAVAQVRAVHPDLLLFIGGKGALQAELEARICREGLQNNVQMLGFIPDVDLAATYAAADLTLVPTITLEGFGLVTIESLASGTPVLGTPVGGTPEILRELDPHLVFDAPSPTAIADRLDAVLSGRVCLPDRDACRAYAARYGWDALAPRLRALFDELGC